MQFDGPIKINHCTLVAIKVLIDLPGLKGLVIPGDVAQGAFRPRVVVLLGFHARAANETKEPLKIGVEDRMTDSEAG
jgi:hypothetical protein